MGCGSSSTAVHTIRIEPDHSRRNSGHDPHNHVTEENRSITSVISTSNLKKKRKSSDSSSNSKESIRSISRSNKQETSTPETPTIKNGLGLQNKDLEHNELENNNIQDNVNPVNHEQEESEQQVLNCKTGDNEIKTELNKAGEEQHVESLTEDTHDQTAEENAYLSNANNRTEESEIVIEQSRNSGKETVELKEQTSTNRITKRHKPQPSPFGPENKFQEDRWAKHDRIALEKEERRLKYDYDMREQILLTDFTPIDMPAMDEIPEQSVPTYTTLDIQAHNMDHPSDWFKYGRKIYSNYKFWPIVKGRAEEYNKVVNENTEALTTETVLNPVLTARELGVPRKVVRQLLPRCLVGIFVDVPLEEYLSNMKEGVEGILEDLNDGEDMPESKYVQEYKQQLSRWLTCYPNIQRDNRLQDYSIDPNEVAFPLPSEILNAPNVLRQWVDTFEQFDTDVPEEGAWRSIKPGVMFETNDDVIKPEPEEQLDDLDMTIDDEVAWSSIDTDLFKNDVTTSEQDTIWKLRETRTNLDDTKWMATRRQAIGDSLTVRHEWEPHTVVPYLKCCDNLDESWNKFQELCKKEFVQRPVEIVTNNSSNGQNEANGDIMRLGDNEIERNQPTPPELETKDSGLDLTSSEPLEQENDNSPRDKEGSVSRPTSETTDDASNQVLDN